MRSRGLIAISSLKTKNTQVSDCRIVGIEVRDSIFSQSVLFFIGMDNHFCRFHFWKMGLLFNVLLSLNLRYEQQFDPIK